MKINATRILIFSVFLMLAPLSFSFLSLRSMMSEGAHWYYTILDYGNYFSDPLFFRYVDFLIQYPALFFLKHFGDSFANGTANIAAIYILSFCWTFHPMVSLYVTYRILRSYSRVDLFIFPVIAFISAFMPASAYAVALALPAMSFFWPLFFCIFFAKGNSLKDYVVTTLLLVGLALCYEPTIIFFILFIMMALADLLWLKVKSKKYNSYLILLCLLAIVFLLWVISTVPDKNTGPFWRSLVYGDWTTRLMGLAVTFSVCSILFFNFVVGRFKSIVNVLAIALFFVITLYFFIRLNNIYSRDVSEGALGWAYDSRSSALPLTWCVAAFCWFFCCFEHDDKWLPSRISQVVSVLVLLATLATAYMDFNQTKEWNFYFERFQNLVSQNKGCVHLSYGEFINEYKAPSVEAYSSAYASVMVQVLKAEGPIRTLVFAGVMNGEAKSSSTSCPERLGDNSFLNESGFVIVLNKGRLIFSENDLLYK